MFENKYEILECIKKSEYGAVYLATRLKDNEKVVIKTLEKTLVEDDENERRFYREAQILADLESSNIIKLIEFGEDDGHLFITFEYFESKNFRYYFSDENISEEDKKNLVIQLCLGLSYLHENDIIHRDLKPENILVNNKLKLKISDFGLALSLNDDFTTQINSIVGTPCYMSPEQIQGKKLTHQSDLFSLGTIIFELYSNKNLFLSSDFNSTINNILNTNWSSIEQQIQEFPDEIQNVLELLLQKDSALRADNISDILEVLVSGSSSFPKRTHKPTFEIKYLVYIIPILVVLFILYFLNEKESESKPVQNNSTSELSDTIRTDSTFTNFEVGEIKSSMPTNRNEEENSNIPKVNLNLENQNGNVEETINKETILTGYLFVDSFPWSNISIGDNDLGVTPFERSVELTAGNHELKISHPDYPVITKNVSIVPDSTIKLIINIEKEFGYLNCKVFPWANIYINNELIGQTPFEKPVPLLPGKYKVKIMNPDFEETIIERNITRNETQTINFRFAEPVPN